MRISSSLLAMAILLGAVVAVSAAPPEKPRLMQYSRLWVNSPFTIKPVKAPIAAASPLERDWMLGSIRPSGSGYSVTLINKKDRKDRIRFLPGFSSGDYQLIQVQQDTKNNENSRVQIRKGSQTAWISYDVKLIKVRPTAVAKSSNRNKPPGATKGRAKPPIPGRSSSTTSKPRVRSVPRSKGR